MSDATPGAARDRSAPTGRPAPWTRRRVLGAGVGTLSFVALSRLGLASALAGTGRRIRLLNTHTLERADVWYHDGADLVPGALAEVDRILRDHRTGEVHAIRPAVLDIAWALAAAVGAPAGEYEIISGYRSRETNDMLRAAHSGVASRSLHCEGRAIDLRLPGVATSTLRDAALALARGGVGWYAASDFVHVDDGRVRRW